MDLQHSTLEPSCCTGIQSRCGRRVLSSCIRICFEQILSSYICITFFLNKTHFQPTIIILYMHQNWFSTNYYHMYYICIRISFEQLLSYCIYIYASEFVFNQLRSLIIFPPTNPTFMERPNLDQFTMFCWRLWEGGVLWRVVSDLSAVFFIFFILDLSRNTDKCKC